MPRNTTSFPVVNQIREISIRVVVAVLGAFLLAWCMMATGHSGVEDEAIPNALVPREDGFAAPGVAEPIPTGPVPAEVIDAIEELLQKQAFDGTVIPHHGEYDVGFDYAYRCQRYRIHLRRGNFPEPSQAILGPTQDGFRITLKWYHARLEDQIRGPATPSPISGRVSPYQYWYAYVNHYQLPNNGGFVRLEWDLGKQSDRKIFADVRALMEKFGTPVEKETPDIWPDQADKLSQQLTDIVGKLQPEAKWRRDGQSLVCEYKTHEFDNHQVSEDGVVAAVAHREVGPLTGGFIIRLTPDRDFDDSGRRVKPIYGRTTGPYWHHYYAVYGDFGNGRIRLDLLYSHRADKKVLEEVTSALEKTFGVPDRF